MPILVSKSSTATIGSIGPVEVIITHVDDSIRLGDGTNLTDVTINGELETINASIGMNGQPAPASSTQVGAVNPSGDLVPLEVNAAGELKVAGLAVFDTQDVKVLFDKTPAPIAIGIETLVNTYTAPPAVISYLLNIRASGENRAEYNVYLDSVLLDQDYTNVTDLKALFDYKTGASSVPGMIIPTGSIIELKATNNGTTTANYSARFLILEVT